MKIASNAAIFSCCTGKCLAKCVQLNIYCSSMLKSSFVGAALLLQFDIEAFCFGYHLLVRLLFFFLNFLFARLSHKRFFVISHSTGRQAEHKEQRQDPRTQCVLDWPAGPGGFAFVSIPYRACHPCHSSILRGPTWEKREPCSNNDPSWTMANDLAKSPSLFLAISHFESLNVKYCAPSSSTVDGWSLSGVSRPRNDYIHARRVKIRSDKVRECGRQEVGSLNLARYVTAFPVCSNLHFTDTKPNPDPEPFPTDPRLLVKCQKSMLISWNVPNFDTTPPERRRHQHHR